MKNIKVSPTIEVPQLAISSYQGSLSTELINISYESGIRLFNTSSAEAETEKTLGVWMNNGAVTDVYVSTRVDTRNVSNLKDVIRYSIDRLNTTKIFFHISFMSIEDSDTYIPILKDFVVDKQILGFGVKTYDMNIAKHYLLQGISTVQLPVNIIEHDLFLKCKPIITERKITTIATDVLGGGLFTGAHPLEFLVRGTLSLIGDNVLSVHMRNKEEIDTIKAIVDTYDSSEIYPLISDICNNCQICNKVCMNNYPLSAAVRYSRYTKASGDLSTWGKEQLQELAIAFDCVNCRMCIDNCPLKLPVKTYIQESMNALLL